MYVYVGAASMHAQKSALTDHLERSDKVWGLLQLQLLLSNLVLFLSHSETTMQEELMTWAEVHNAHMMYYDNTVPNVPGNHTAHMAMHHASIFLEMT